MPQDSTELRIVLVEEGAAGQPGAPSPTPGGATGVYPGASAAGGGGGTGAAGAAASPAAGKSLAQTALDMMTGAKDLGATGFRSAAEQQAAIARSVNRDRMRDIDLFNVWRMSLAQYAQALGSANNQVTSILGNLLRAPSLAATMAGQKTPSQSLAATATAQYNRAFNTPPATGATQNQPGGVRNTLGALMDEYFGPTLDRVRAAQQRRDQLGTGYEQFRKPSLAEDMTEAFKKSTPILREWTEGLRGMSVAMIQNRHFEALAGGASLATTALSRMGGAAGATGQALGVVVEAAKGVYSLATALAERGRELSPFSGPLSSAVARSEIRSLLMDIREAQTMGPSVAKLIDAQSRLEITMRELFLPMKTAWAESMTRMAEDWNDLLNPVDDPRWEQLGMQRAQLEWMQRFGGQWAADSQQQIAALTEEMRKIREALTGQVADNFTRQMEMLEQQARTPDWDPRREVGDQKVNIPAFHNLPGF